MEKSTNNEKISELTPGFYRHYKHDPLKGINDHVYEFINIGHHTEINGLDESAMVVYQPIYEQVVYAAGKHWDLRPRMMFLSDKEIEKISFFIKFFEAIFPFLKRGSKKPLSVKRFTRIEDPELVKKLVEIRNKMYGMEFKYYTGEDL
jgi:hypothetical protein